MPSPLLIPLGVSLLSPPGSSEQWQSQQARTGDHIRVSRGLYTHHGIYVSDSEVIHFTALEDDNLLGGGNEVMATPLSRFLLDRELEVRIYTEEELEDLFPVADIVRWARASCGDSGYHLFFNNCEHFANCCTLGRFHSQQVMNVFGGINMGLKDWASGVLGAVFGGSSGGGGRSRSTESSTYNYEPDKVRVAEIQAESARDMAYHENQRIGLIKDAQIELSEFNARMEAAVIEAKVRGFTHVQGKLLEMTKTLTQLAQERIVLLEQGHLGVVSQIDNHYQQLKQQIGNENDLYLHEKFPKLLSLLEQYTEGSTSRKKYSELLDKDMARHIDFQAQQTQSMHQRLGMMTESAITSKKQLEQHVNTLVETRMQQLQLSLENTSQLPLAQLLVYKQKLLMKDKQAE